MTRRQDRNTRSLLVFALMVFFNGASSAAGMSQYSLGVLPFMPMGALIKYFNSVSADLTQQVNKRVIAQTRSSFKEFQEEIEKETYDIVFIQPFDYPLAYSHNYRPLARRPDDLEAILVTNLESNVTSISELANKTLANPPAESAVSIVVQKELDSAGVGKTVRMIYTRNHFSCIQMVLVGKADACSTNTSVLFNWENSGMKKEKLRVFHKAKPIPHTLYMVHNRVPAEDQLKIKNAILSWDKRPAGKMILKQFAMPPFTETKDADYNVIRHYSE